MNLRPFYIGNPLDGCAQTNDLRNCKVFEAEAATGGGIATVPAGKKWLIEQVVVVNLTSIWARWSGAFFPPNVNSGTFQFDPGALGPGPGGDPLTRSIAGGAGASPLGGYFAFSEPLPPGARLREPVLWFGLGGQKLWVGAYPGRNGLLGAGGVSMAVLGVEMRDG